MRVFYCCCGVLALALGLLTFWLNPLQGFAGAERLCDAGFCDAELIQRAARASTLAGVQQLPLRLQNALLRRDAASPLTWADAAFAYEQAGDRAKARYCAARAAQLGPGSAPLLMRVLHFYLGEDSREDVLSTGKALLALSRDYDDFVFRYYDAEEAPAADVLARGLPVRSDAATAYLGSRIGAGDVKAAGETFDWIQAHSLLTEPALNSYVWFLLRNKAVDAALQAWDAYHAKERERNPGNLIYNPGFETPFSKGPLDWRFDDVAGATIEPDGKGTLKIVFQGEDNIDFHHVSQLVPISRRPLRFKARVKADGLTTNEGVAVLIYDRENPARFHFTTEQLTGDADWKQWDYPLAIPAATGLLELRIIRQRSLKFDNKIRGTAWFSTLALEPAGK